MNDNAHDDATNQTVSFKNEYTPDAAIFSGSAPAPTATSSVSTIFPDAHIPPSGQKTHEAIFSSEHE